MKKLSIFLFSIMICVMCGCKSEKIQVIQTTDTTCSTNQVRVQSNFNHQKYIWEYFIFSTNKADNVKY